MSEQLRGTQSEQNIVEKAVSRMMGGGTAEGDQHPNIVVGQEYGRTPYSGEAEKAYEGKRNQRQTLDTSEYYAVTQGYLREWTCMGQCNLYIQVLRNPMLRQAMETYRHDVCEPYLTETKLILDAGRYQYPAPYNGVQDAKSQDSLGKLETDAIDDRMIMVGHIFSVEAFMGFSCQLFLNATGRIPNTDQLDLVRLGLAVPPGAAIPVNAYSETTAPGIYAVGDVTDRINLTPVAIAEGRAFADSVFGGQDMPFHDDQVATAVFTDPPIGTVGLSEQEAAARGATIIYASQFRPMALAFSGRKEYSHIKLVVDAKSDRVLGIHMIGSDAPEIIQSLAVSLRSNVTKRQFDQTIAVHPTTAEEFVLLREPLRRLPGPM